MEGIGPAAKPEPALLSMMSQRLGLAVRRISAEPVPTPLAYSKLTDSGVKRAHCGKSCLLGACLVSGFGIIVNFAGQRGEYAAFVKRKAA